MPRLLCYALCHVPLVMTTHSTDTAVHWLVEFYESDLPSSLNVNTEVHQWKRKYCECNASDLPDNPFDALNKCDPQRIFPNIVTLLKILRTIPVTLCEAEHSFSALCRLKTFLHSTVSEDRLNGLALLNIHHDIKIDLDNAVDMFAWSHPRKLQILWLLTLILLIFFNVYVTVTH